MKSELLESGLYLRNLISRGENQHLDFKFEISDAKKVARTFSAFANTEGGTLLIGVKDNGRISGIRTDEELYMAESAAQLHCKPEVRFSVQKWFTEGRCVLGIDIPASAQRPHFAKNDEGDWTAYVRVGDENIRAGRVLVNYWKGSRDEGVMLNYGREEKYLMDFLLLHDHITLSQFMKIARLGRQEAENVLVNLSLMQVIKIDTTPDAVYFRLTGKHQPG
jgi:predicted HTH transcriptional regulator